MASTTFLVSLGFGRCAIYVTTLELHYQDRLCTKIEGIESGYATVDKFSNLYTADGICVKLLNGLANRCTIFDPELTYFALGRPFTSFRAVLICSLQALKQVDVS